MVDKKKKLHKFRAQIAIGGVAQVVRACGSYPQGHWFKSSHRHHKNPTPVLTLKRQGLFSVHGAGDKPCFISMAVVEVRVAAGRKVIRVDPKHFNFAQAELEYCRWSLSNKRNS